MALDLAAFNELAGIDTDPDVNVIEALRFDDALEIPHQLTDVDMWNNYCDERLYQLDKEVRRFITASKYTRQSKGCMKTAVPLVFAFITGRNPGPEDSQICVIVHRLLREYCTRYTGSSKIGGKRVTRVYHFSKYAMTNRRPVSLRLRLEDQNGTLREYGNGADKGPKPRPRNS